MVWGVQRRDMKPVPWFVMDLSHKKWFCIPSQSVYGSKPFYDFKNWGNPKSEIVENQGILILVW